MPIIAINTPFAAFLKIHFSELSCTNPLSLRNFVILIFHYRLDCFRLYSALFNSQNPFL